MGEPIGAETDVTREALWFLRTHYENWLKLRLTTLAERRLAQAKVELIDAELRRTAPAVSDTDDIDVLNLSVRAYNVLMREGVKTVGQLCALTEADLLRFRNMTAGAIVDVSRQLQSANRELAGL